MWIENNQNFDIQNKYNENLNKLNDFLKKYNFKAEDIFYIGNNDYLIFWENNENRILNSKNLNLRSINPEESVELNSVIWAPISQEQKLEELNDLLKNLPTQKQKNFLEEWFKDNLTYEVQKENWSESLYSIFNKMLNEHPQKEKLVLFRSLLLNWVEQNLINPQIHKWDTIKMDFEDTNSIHLYINWNTHILNISNYTIDWEKVEK